MDIPDIKSKDLDCPKSNCKVVLLLCHGITTAYDWAIPFQCNRCKTVRFMCKECVSPRKFGGNYILHKQYLWRHNKKHMRNKDFSETKSDNISKSIGLVLTDNNHNITVNNEIVSHTMDILRTVDEQGSNNINSHFVGDSDSAPSTLDVMRVRNSEDRISTDTLKSPSTPLVLSTGSNMENEVKDIYDNNASYEYFTKNASRDENDTGPAFLVGQAVTGTNSAHKSMRNNDILLHLLLAKFTATLTVDQKQQFSMILQLITKKIMRSPMVIQV